VLPVVIDCSHIYQTDFTAGKGFKSMLEDFESRAQPVYWLRPQPHVHHTLQALAGNHFVTISSVDQLVHEEEPEDQLHLEVDRHTGPLLEGTPSPVNNGTSIHTGTPAYNPTHADVENGHNVH